MPRNYTAETLYDACVALYYKAGGKVTRASFADCDEAVKAVYQWLASLVNLDGAE